MGVIRHVDAGHAPTTPVAAHPDGGVRMPRGRVMTFDRLWDDLDPVGRDRAPAATAGSPGPAEDARCASGSPARPPPAGWTS